MPGRRNYRQNREEPHLYKYWAAALGAALLCTSGMAKEPTKADESSYNKDILDANSSEGLSNADLAWHALNTYGFDCAEVISKSEPAAQGNYVITCANGLQLNVFPRARKYPRITGVKSDIQ